MSESISIEERLQNHVADISSLYPPAGAIVDGRTVRSGIPNQASIAASLEEYEVLPQVREVPFDRFDQMGPLTFVSASEKTRTEDLANAIRDSKEISPLIIAIDEQGPYVLEGAHRFDALRILGATSFPAQIVVDIASLRNHAEHAGKLDETGFWGAAAAGCVFLARDTGRIMIAHRSDEVLEPETWGTWGGALDKNEAPDKAVFREIKEEAGYKGECELIPLAIFSHPSGFRYFNFLAIVDSEFVPVMNWETQGYMWTTLDAIPSPAHPGLTYLLNHSGADIGRIADSLKAQQCAGRPVASMAKKPS